MRETVTVRELARVLREPCHALFARVLKVLGQERTAALVAEALLCEHHGGVWLQDRSRKRTLCGIFLQLCRERSAPEERARSFGRGP